MRKPPALVFAACLVVTAACAAGCDDHGTVKLALAQIKDPAACQGCHPAQFAEWSASMHAYSADDPVFIAMNQRGQRETDNALGDFCVKCHAPVAVREGLTHDGLNLSTLPPAVKGVTCYFCHAAESIEGTHDNPLVLAADGRLFGPFADPAPATPHGALYSPLFDGARLESAAACGACHDIVNQHDVALERTFQEWQATLFAIPPHGQSCTECHMAGRDGPASTVSDKVRRLHDHGFPAVDVGLTAFPGAAPDAQRQAAQAMLDTVLQGTICLDDVAQKITVALDNVAAGHSWPSGASQDRRAWVEVAAYAGASVLYRSGVAPGETIEAAADPDLWLIRDCIYDETQAEVHMFWQAASLAGVSIPGPVMTNLADPSSFTKTHVRRVYPGAGPLGGSPDRITLTVFLKAIGDDVLQSLIDTHDLDPAVAAAIPRYQLGGGATLEWTRAAASSYVDSKTNNLLSCVSVGKYTPVASVALATSHARCPPP
jgi:hypothetical protein